ncbi:MAG: hypothetical protein ACR2HN_10220 [Tepidiformaceae bacterium]
MRQRLRQFRDAGRRPAAADFALAREHLAPPLEALFAAQHPRDICHAAATARWLLARGYRDSDLLAAALLHDIGKGEQRRFDRCAYVLASCLRMASRMGAAASRFEVRRAIARSVTHAAAGANLLAVAGAPALIIDLTLRHHCAADGDDMLARLREADAAN